MTPRLISTASIFDSCGASAPIPDCSLRSSLRDRLWRRLPYGAARRRRLQTTPFFIILGALENPKIPSHSSFPRRRESTGAPPAFPCLLDSRLRGSDDETGGGEFRVSTATEYNKNKGCLGHSPRWVRVLGHSPRWVRVLGRTRPPDLRTIARYVDVAALRVVGLIPILLLPLALGGCGIPDIVAHSVKSYENNRDADKNGGSVPVVAQPPPEAAPPPPSPLESPPLPRDSVTVSPLE